MDLANRSGRTGLVTKDTGKTIERTGEASLFTLMEMSTKEIGSMTRQMATEFIFMSTEQSMKASGKTTSSMAMAKKAGLICLSMRENISLERSTGAASIAGMTDLVTTENGRKTKLKG